MTWILAGLAVLVLMGLTVHGFATASVAQVRRGGAILLAVFGAAAFGLLVYSGRMAQAAAALLPMAPLALQLWRGWRQARRFGAAPASAGTTTQVETETLLMRLDLGSGQLSGRVRSGPQAGRELGEMALPELLALLRHCREEDAESLPLLENWLDHAYPGWRAEAGGGPQGEAAGHDWALATLGLTAGASPAEIRAAHRRLMQEAHPDRGGPPDRAAALNRARDILLS